MVLGMVAGSLNTATNPQGPSGAGKYHIRRVAEVPSWRSSGSDPSSQHSCDPLTFKDEIEMRKQG